MSRFICLPWVWIELNPTQDPMELVVASIRSIIGPMQALAIFAASFFSLDIVTSSVIARMQLHPPLDSRRYGETHMRGSSKSSTNISRMMPRCPLLFPSMITCKLHQLSWRWSFTRFVPWCFASPVPTWAYHFWREWSARTLGLRTRSRNGTNILLGPWLRETCSKNGVATLSNLVELLLFPF